MRCQIFITEIIFALIAQTLSEIRLNIHEVNPKPISDCKM